MFVFEFTECQAVVLPAVSKDHRTTLARDSWLHQARKPPALGFILFLHVVFELVSLNSWSSILFQKDEPNFPILQMRKNRDFYGVNQWLDLRPGKMIPGHQQGHQEPCVWPLAHPPARAQTHAPVLPALQSSSSGSTCVCLCAEWGRGPCRPRGGVYVTSEQQRPIRGGLAAAALVLGQRGGSSL